MLDSKNPRQLEFYLMIKGTHNTYLTHDQHTMKSTNVSSIQNRNNNKTGNIICHQDGQSFTRRRTKGQMYTTLEPVAYSEVHLKKTTNLLTINKGKSIVPGFI